ncbi:MAG: nucleotide-binding protein [Candidatus Methanofastidiosia archaeon]
MDLSRESLFSRFIEPYEQGKPIIINGKTIFPDDLERIVITESKEHSSKILPRVKRERENSGVVVIGGPPDEWYVVSKGKDITDDLIKGKPGFRKQEERNEGKTAPMSNRVFIVHGHDLRLKDDLEIFLKNMGLEPVVLHRKPDEGQTIIEKLEKYSDVEYAYVLLTPDDIGYSVSEAKKLEERGKMEYRARQNVVFEFGYFVGKLGRGRVCCIYKEGVSLPSDVSGLLYKKVISSIEDIGLHLMKELRAAGYDPLYVA